MFGIGTTELIVILVIVFLIFGPSKLPQMGSAIGKFIQNFKKSQREAELEEREKLEGEKEEKKNT